MKKIAGPKWQTVYIEKQKINKQNCKSQKLVYNDFEKMKITLAIPAFNEEKYIGACLESAVKSRTRAAEEILVINNASTPDQTAQIAASFAGVRVIDEP